MELMYEGDVTPLTILGLDLSPETAQQVRSSAQSHGLAFESQLDQKQNPPAIVFVELNDNNFSTQFSQLSQLHQQEEALTLIVYQTQLNVESLCQVINTIGVYSVIDGLSGLSLLLKKTVDEHRDRKHYFLSLKKVKKQNKTLESLNENLEQVVHERTIKEFNAHKEMESSVKEIQSILSFIKSISRAENTEELMHSLRKEFRKFHGLMPPILLLRNDRKEVHLYYFQGMQIARRKVKDFYPNNSGVPFDEGKMRVALSNLLGRPFGTVSVSPLKLQSKELQGYDARIVFEHSIVEKHLDNYQQFSTERFPIVNMALENILLKEGLQSIAQQWARTFNEMEDPIIIINKQYKVSLSNGDFHNDRSKTCHQSFAGGDKPCKDCPITTTFQTAEPSVADIHLNKKVFRVHSYPIHLDGQGEVSHVINQYVDVTQSIDLQSRVIQGEKMAAVGLLAGNIAHELNNPLTGIRSLADLLLEDFEPNSNTHKDLSEVRDASVRCQRIIKDLLDFSSVGNDKSTLATPVNQLISKTLPLLKVAMRTLNSTLDFSESEIRVACQPQLLQQVIFNLLNNACQAMGEEGVLTVITRQRQGHAEIVVRDTGPGIPPEIQQSVFDPFFTTKKEGKGTGLGLSMSKSVIDRAGGTLHLNKDYKDGTEFVITLPLVEK